jgi:hypothetical protein
MKKFNIELTEEQFAEIEKIAEFDGRGIKNQCEKFVSVMINLYKNNVNSYSNTEINLYNESKKTSIRIPTMYGGALKSYEDMVKDKHTETTKDGDAHRTIQYNGEPRPNVVNATAPKKRTEFKKPSEDDVFSYMVSISFPNAKEEASNFHNYYSPEWKDSNDKPVKNWKAKVKFWKSQRPTEQKESTLTDFEELAIEKYAEVYLMKLGNEPNIDGSEKFAMTKLLAYLVSEAEKTGKQKEAALDSIRLILSNIDLWGEMYNKKVSVSHILKHINQIIINIKKYTAYFQQNIEVMKQMNPNYAMNTEDRAKWIVEFNSKNK